VVIALVAIIVDTADRDDHRLTPEFGNGVPGLLEGNDKSLICPDQACHLTPKRDIVERTRFSTRVHAGMAGARATAAVLAGHPVLGVALGQLIGAYPLRFLLSGRHRGGWRGC
jgi:hypothetical protein